MNWRLVGAKVIMKDKRERDVETDAETGGRNGRRVFLGGTDLTMDPDGLS